jgi:hypothetical protein
MWGGAVGSSSDSCSEGRRFKSGPRNYKLKLTKMKKVIVPALILLVLVFISYQLFKIDKLFTDFNPIVIEQIMPEQKEPEPIPVVPVVKQRATFEIATYEPRFFNLASGDTVEIYRTDLVSGVTIFVPDGSSDSVRVSGRPCTIAGMTSDTVKVAPGYSMEIGYNPQVRIDSLVIIAKDNAQLLITPIR